MFYFAPYLKLILYLIIVSVFKREGDRINENEIKIIKQILDEGITHYKNIEHNIGMSRKTINKYLNEIASEVKAYQIKLVRKPSVGIYFSGDTTHIRLSLQNGELIANRQSPQEIKLAILSFLLTSKEHITIQNLSDKYYVSRTTIESYLKQLKDWLKKKGAKLVSDEKGICLDASENVRRRLMTILLDFYWGNNLEIKNNADLKLAVNIPKELKSIFNPEIFYKVVRTLNQFQKNNSIRLNDYQFQSLAVHLVIAIQRIKNKEIIIANEELTNHPLSPKTVILSKLLEKNLELTIPVEEQAYINIHILAAESNSGVHLSLKNDKKLFRKSELVQFLKVNLTNYDKALISNLTLHLVPALHRLSLGLSMKNPYKNSIKGNFPYAYNQAVDLSIEIGKHFLVNVNDDEIAYIALHIESFLERREEKKIKTVIVCSTGLGTARLLEQRIKKYFADEIEINRVVSVSELMSAPITEDLIISTVDIDLQNKNVVVVPPFLDYQSKGRLQAVINKFKQFQENSGEFMKLVEPDLIIVDNKRTTRNQAIRTVCELLCSKQYALSGIADAAIKREKMASTEMDFVAIPHAPIQYVKRARIALYINSEGVDWDKGRVNLVFFMAMNESVKTSIDQIYNYFNTILEDKKLLKTLCRLTSKTEIIKLLGSEEFE